MEAAAETKSAGGVQDCRGIVEEEAAEIVNRDRVGFGEKQRHAMERDVRYVGPQLADQTRHIEMIHARGIAASIGTVSKLERQIGEKRLGRPVNR